MSHTPRQFSTNPADHVSWPMLADTAIALGEAVGRDGNLAQPLDNADGEFCGFAVKAADNTGGAAAAASVEVATQGSVWLTVAGIANQGQAENAVVYASNSTTFTTTASTNQPIGVAQVWRASDGKTLVHFKGKQIIDGFVGVYETPA